MAEPKHDAPASCPRCSSAGAEIVARSPVDGVWVMHLCPTCFYTWRSTEGVQATTAEAMVPGFRIDPAGIAQGLMMPVIPPLRPAK